MTPTSSSSFFDDEQHEASRLKVEGYAKYLKPLAYKILSWKRRLWIVDGYAGAGEYAPDETGYAAPGSPLVAARFARQYNVDNARRGKQISLINVEKEREIFERLETTLAPLGDVARNLRGSFHERLDEVLKTIGRDPALFFLDSFGMEAADIRVVERILARPPQAITELLVHFSDRALQRIAGNLDAHTTTERGELAARTKVENLDEILGTSWWRGPFRDPALTTEERCNRVAELYMAQLRDLGVPYVYEMRMRDRYDDPPRYRLIFMTRSPHGVYLLSDISARQDAELFSSRWEGSFELELKRQERQEQREQLIDEMHAWGLAQGSATPVEIYCEFAPRYFGRWTSTDYDRLLRRLVEDRRIDRPNSRGIKPGERLRFVMPPQEPLFDTRTG